MKKVLLASLIISLALMFVVGAGKVDKITGEFREADSASSSVTSTTIIATATQAILSNSFNANSNAIMAYTADLPATPADGDVVEVMNAVGAGAIDGYAKLMMHFNGNILDSSLIPKTATESAEPTTSDTTNKKFGSASRAFNGSSQYLTLADSDDFTMGTDDFNIEAWVRFSVTNLEMPIFAQEYGTDGNNLFTLIYRPAGSLSLEKATSANNIFKSTIAFTPSVGEWYHLCVARSGTTLKMFINGQSQNITFDAGSGATNITDVNGVMHIGYRVYGGKYFGGQLDELKIDKGTARNHTANFTPATNEYEQGGVITVNPPDAVAIGTQAVGVSRILSSKGDYEKYRFDGVQWWVVGHEGNPTIGN